MFEYKVVKESESIVEIEYFNETTSFNLQYNNNTDIDMTISSELNRINSIYNLTLPSSLDTNVFIEDIGYKNDILSFNLVYFDKKVNYTLSSPNDFDDSFILYIVNEIKTTN